MEEILKAFAPEQKEPIHILHKIQEQEGHISSEAISAIADYLRISANEIFSVLTFYKAFTLEPRGRHIVTVCQGTACHVRGGPRIVDEMARKLALEPGQTTPDREFTLETVNCVGCCAIGPVAVVNGKYYSHMTPAKVDALLREYGHDK